MRRAAERFPCKRYGSAGRSTALLFGVRAPSPRQPALLVNSAAVGRGLFFVYLGPGLLPILVGASLGAAVFFPELIGPHTEIFKLDVASPIKFQAAFRSW